MTLPPVLRRALLVSLLLLPAVSQAVTTYNQTDTTTQGQWIGVYGASGYILNDYDRVPTNSGSVGVYNAPASPTFDLASLPSYITSYSYDANSGDYVWESNVTDFRAPQDPRDPAGLRNAATTFNAINTSFSMTLQVAQPKQFQLAVYALDWDSGNTRSMTMSVEGASVPVSNYAGGHWVVFDVDAAAGPLTISLANGPVVNAVISAVAFNTVPEPSCAAFLGLGVLGLAGVRRRR